MVSKHKNGMSQGAVLRSSLVWGFERFCDTYGLWLSLAVVFGIVCSLVGVTSFLAIRCCLLYFFGASYLPSGVSHIDVSFFKVVNIGLSGLPEHSAVLCGWHVAVWLATQIVSVWLIMGALCIARAVYRGARARLWHMRSAIPHVGTGVCVVWSYLLICGTGFLLGVVPGIYLGVRWWWALHYAVDGYGCFQAFGASWRRTRGAFARHLLYAGSTWLAWYVCVATPSSLWFFLFVYPMSVLGMRFIYEYDRPAAHE